MCDALIGLGRDASMTDLVRETGMTRMRCLRILGLCIRDGLIRPIQKNGRKAYRAVSGEQESDI